MEQENKSKLRKKLYHIIFEAETVAGKTFDVVLLVAILLSVLIVTLESVQQLKASFGVIFFWAEIAFTLFFTVEYFLRIYSAPRPAKYIFSFFGLVDLLAIIPTYFSLFFSGAYALLIIRVLRLLRVARIFKLTRFISEGEVLSKALKASVTKILVFIGAVLSIVVIVGAIMYLVEGPENGFDNIPISIYWTIVTLTTVGYGDIAPGTALGKFLASIVMIMGYGIIAVPTGIVSVELAKSENLPPANRVCANCFKEGHRMDAAFCYNCGVSLITPENADPII
jgi:voltage-gated potassium channel